MQLGAENKEPPHFVCKKNTVDFKKKTDYYIALEYLFNMMHDHTYFFYEGRHFDVNTFPLPVTLSFTGAEMDVPARGWVVFFWCEAVSQGIQPQDDLVSVW